MEREQALQGPIVPCEATVVLCVSVGKGGYSERMEVQVHQWR